MRYGTGILQWRVDELKELDRKARKLVKMHRRVHPKCDEDRLSVSRNEGARGLASCESATRSEENSIRWYLKNSDESLLQRVKRVRILQFFVFFLSGFQDSREWEGTIFYSTLPFPPAHEHSDIYFATFQRETLKNHWMKKD